eukprot:COSAG06_NODE_29896_length_548_cov_4.775056_1_plen_75_part_10
MQTQLLLVPVGSIIKRTAVQLYQVVRIRDSEPAGRFCRVAFGICNAVKERRFEQCPGNRKRLLPSRFLGLAGSFW